MKGKEAREIIEDAVYWTGGNRNFRFYSAEGYLECLEKVKGLEEALEKIGGINGLKYSDIFRICDETLAKWRKVK